MIPGWSVSAFEGDGDDGVTDSDGVGEVLFNFFRSPISFVNGELSAEGIVDGVERLDDKRAIMCSIVLVHPEILHCKVGGISCVDLGFLSVSESVGSRVSGSSEEGSCVTGGGRECGGCIDLVFYFLLPLTNSWVAEEV